MRISGWAVLAVIVMTSGCAGNYQSIYRHNSLDNSKSSITTIDAKQRVIITANGGNGLKFCVEPSPDVFSVVAQAISAGGTFGRGGDPKAIEAALNAAFSRSEHGSTIPRTQTINMLRELMYRTCERWLNNELVDAEMPIQAARDQRLMVSILAIEQLTGAVTPRPVVVGSSSRASTGSSGADAVVRIDDALKTLQAKTAAEEARQKEFDALNSGTNSCEALASRAEVKEELDDEQKQANEKCNNARTLLARAKLERASAAAHNQYLLDASRAGGLQFSVTSAADSREASGGIDRAHASSVETIAAIVKDIVEMNFQDEFLLFCLKVLSVDPTGTGAISVLANDSTAREACISNIKSSIELETSRLNISAARLQDTLEGIQSEVDEGFARFWNQIKAQDGQADQAILDAIMQRVGISSEGRACLQNSTAKAEVKSCFLQLGSGAQRALANGGRN